MKVSWVIRVLAAVTGVTLAASGSAALAGAAGTGPSPGAVQAGVITTVGGGLGGPGAGRSIAVDQPCGVAWGKGGPYLTESAGDLVRRVAAGSGLLSNVAGSGPHGPGALDSPCGVVDAAGNLIFADTGDGVVRVLAGRSGAFFGKRMRAGNTYVIGGSSFSSPDAISVDRHGNLLVTSRTSYYGEGGGPGTAVVSVLAGARGSFYGRQMVPGHVYPLAGQDCPGAPQPGCQPGFTGDGGPALAATFGPELQGVVTDPSGNVVIADTANGRIRVVAERSGRFYGRQMTARHIYTIAGGSTGGLGDGGPADQAVLRSPRGLTFDRAGNLVVSDSGDQRIRVMAERSGRFYGRQMTAGHIYTIAGGGSGGLGDGGLATRARLYQPAGVGFDGGGNLVVADQGHNRVRVLAERSGRFYGRRMTAGHIYTIAGNGYAAYSGDGGRATRAQLSPFAPIITGSDGHAADPAGLAVRPDGSIIVADTANNRIRMIAEHSGTFYGVRMTAGRIYTVGGTGRSGFSGNNGRATRAELAGPDGVAVDRAGNILVSDIGNDRVRVIAARTGRFYGRRMTAGDIYFLAGGGTAGGNGLPASHVMLEPLGLTVDQNGNVLIADFGSIGPQVLAEKAGTFYGQPMKPGYVYNLYPTPVGNAYMNAFDLAVDHAGNVVVASSEPSQVDVIPVRTGRYYGVLMHPGYDYAVAGTGRDGLSGDGGPATAARLSWPTGIAVDAAGNLLLADSANNRIRVVAERSGTFYGVRMTAGDIYTVAGGGHYGLGDLGLATRAELRTPSAVVPYRGGLLVLDNLHARIREITG